MRVQWSEYNHNLAMMSADLGLEIDPEELELHYSGETLGVYKHWRYGVMIVVMCDDGIVRETSAKNIHPEHR